MNALLFGIKCIYIRKTDIIENNREDQCKYTVSLIVIIIIIQCRAQLGRGSHFIVSSAQLTVLTSEYA